MRFNGNPVGIIGFNNLTGEFNGVQISATASAIQGGNEGVVTLLGPVHSIAVSGFELGIDNVTFVPEPSSLALLAMGGAGLFARRRRNG